MQTDALKQILALARAGATSRAWEAFKASGLDRADADASALTLKGRLLKDQARHAPAHLRPALFALAGEAYEHAARPGAETYPLINAAAMALHAGERERSAELAGKVLHLIESGLEKGETPYWGEATRAEALLLLNRIEDARSSLAHAVSLAPQAWEDHAATLRQFGLILSELDEEDSWLDSFRPAPAMHFNGILGIAADDKAASNAIAAEIRAIAPGFAYGALAAGADIIAAEAAVLVGAELHVVLPSDPHDFRKTSVEPLGEDWPQRFDSLLEIADTLIICDKAESTSAAGVALAELHAMGLALERASQLQAQAVALRIEPADRPVLGDPWLQSGMPTRHVAVLANTKSAVPQLPAGELKFDIATDDTAVTSFGSLEDCVQALRKSGSVRMAIDCRLGETVHVKALLPHSAYGMVAASRSAALGLLASGLASRIETIGELAFPEGPVELCLAKLSEPPG